MMSRAFSRYNSKRAFQAILCLFAYLFIGLSGTQTALALSSAFAGPHDVGLVNDGDHQDVVFTHHHINAQIKAHHHSHSHGALHHHASEEFNSIFGTHTKPHPDHVVHLPQSHEEIISQVSGLTFDTPYFYDLSITTVMSIPVDSFCKTVSIQALPQPPPRLPSTLAFLHTVILLI